MGKLDQINDEIARCRKCRLGYSRTHAVPGEGPEDAEVMFIGEAPGFHEDRQGRPFVGASGHFLDELLEEIGLKREDVFITNVVKCRPPGNRDPKPDELKACAPYLERQIEMIKPKVIVTLGRFSMERYFPGASITRIHGNHKRIGSTIYMATFHPAAALRQPKWRDTIRDDFQKIPELLKMAKEHPVEEEQSTPDDEKYTQLRLF